MCISNSSATWRKLKARRVRARCSPSARSRASCCRARFSSSPASRAARWRAAARARAPRSPPPPPPPPRRSPRRRRASGAPARCLVRQPLRPPLPLSRQRWTRPRRSRSPSSAAYSPSGRASRASAPRTRSSRSSSSRSGASTRSASRSSWSSYVTCCCSPMHSIRVRECTRTHVIYEYIVYIPSHGVRCWCAARRTPSRASSAGWASTRAASACTTSWRATACASRSRGSASRRSLRAARARCFSHSRFTRSSRCSGCLSLLRCTRTTYGSVTRDATPVPQF